jgi:hypothetical protein
MKNTVCVVTGSLNGYGDFFVSGVMTTDVTEEYEGATDSILLEDAARHVRLVKETFVEFNSAHFRATLICHGVHVYPSKVYTLNNEGYWDVFN